MNRDEILKKLPPGSFLKISESQTVPLPREQRAALIRKGNEAFNQKNFEMAKKIFLTTGYTDGLIRLGDYYYSRRLPLEALRMYWLAPYPKKVNVLIERAAALVKELLKEEGAKSGP